ncbi:hypothetical protein ALON55S_08377 [Alishewanella longhuensis]
MLAAMQRYLPSLPVIWGWAIMAPGQKVIARPFYCASLPISGKLFPKSWQPSAEVQEVLDTCDIVARHGSEALSTYVISMAGKPSDYQRYNCY